MKQSMKRLWALKCKTPPEVHEQRHSPECCGVAETKCWGCFPGEKSHGMSTHQPAQSPPAASLALGSHSQMPGRNDGEGKFRTDKLSPPATGATKERENTIVLFLKTDLLKAKEVGRVKKTEMKLKHLRDGQNTITGVNTTATRLPMHALAINFWSFQWGPVPLA